jgi:hypothetical protein
MIDTAKLLRIVTPLAVVGIGVGGAVLLGGTRERRTLTLTNGTEIVGTLAQPLSTDQSSVGDVVELETTDIGDGAGATLRGTVTHVKGGGRIAGAPELAVLFNELEIDGHRYPISTDTFQVKGQSDAKESALGAVVGAAIGTGVAVVTEGDQLTLNAGQKLRIRVIEPVTVQYRPRATDDTTP